MCASHCKAFEANQRGVCLQMYPEVTSRADLRRGSSVVRGRKLLSAIWLNLQYQTKPGCISLSTRSPGRFFHESCHHSLCKDARGTGKENGAAASARYRQGRLRGSTRQRCAHRFHSVTLRPVYGEKRTSTLGATRQQGLASEGVVVVVGSTRALYLA